MIHGRKLTVAERINAMGWLGTLTSDGGATFVCMNHGELYKNIVDHVSPIMGVELEEVIEDFLDHWWCEHAPHGGWEEHIPERDKKRTLTLPVKKHGAEFIRPAELMGEFADGNKGE